MHRLIDSLPGIYVVTLLVSVIVAQIWDVLGW